VVYPKQVARVVCRLDGSQPLVVGVAVGRPHLARPGVAAPEVVGQRGTGRPRPEAVDQGQLDPIHLHFAPCRREHHDVHAERGAPVAYSVRRLGRTAQSTAEMSSSSISAWPISGAGLKLAPVTAIFRTRSGRAMATSSATMPPSLHPTR
jgi:hypothetical protein